MDRPAGSSLKCNRTLGLAYAIATGALAVFWDSLHTRIRLTTGIMAVLSRKKKISPFLSRGGAFYHCLLDAGIVLETSKPETAFSSHNSELFCKCNPALLQMPPCFSANATPLYCKCPPALLQMSPRAKRGVSNPCGRGLTPLLWLHRPTNTKSG